MNLLETNMEELIIKNPEKYLNEKGLKLVSRQYSIGGYRFDLLFEDRHGAKLIVEIQRGTLDRNHTYKILDYYDEFKEQNPNEFVELMVIANKIPRERRNRLTSKGISFREIPEIDFLEDPNGISKKNEALVEISVKGDRGVDEKNLDHPTITSKNNQTAIETLENKFSIGNNNEGKQKFEKLVLQNSWKNECSKLTEMSLHRKNQLIQVFKKYHSIRIPFSQFNSTNIKNPSLRNSQIFPLICAYHVGYFNVSEDSLVLKNNYIKVLGQLFPEINEFA